MSKVLYLKQQNSFILETWSAVKKCLDFLVHVYIKQTFDYLVFKLLHFANLNIAIL